jgi:hypothetical protein
MTITLNINEINEISNTNTNINDNLIWLEQETKINNTLAIAEEARARTIALNMAVSSIKDITAMVKSLKSKIDSLKAELVSVKQTNELLMQKRKWLNDEEKEHLRPQITDIIINHFVEIHYSSNGGSKARYEPHRMYEMYKETIDIFVNVILNYSINENQCIRIANKSKNVLSHHKLQFNPDNMAASLKTTNTPFHYYRDYKIIYFAFYEIWRNNSKKVPNQNNDELMNRYKSIEDGGQIL